MYSNKNQVIFRVISYSLVKFYRDSQKQLQIYLSREKDPRYF